MTVITTDHAVLRFLERIHGVEVEAARAAMRNDIEHAYVAGLTIARNFVIRTASARYVVRDGRIVTVLAPGFGAFPWDLLS